MGAVGLAFVVLPLAGLLVRVPWADAGDILRREATRDALRISVLTSSASAVLAVVFGLPLAWLLARTDLRGRSLVRTLSTLPLVLPPVVGGVALLATFGRRGIIGRPLDWAFDVTLPLSPAGVVLAGLFIALPFVVITVEAGLRALDPRYEQAAATLGARPWTAFTTITLPLVAPSLAAGAALAWARALGEFGATITFAGSLPGRTETLPSSVYLALENEPGAARMLSVLLVAVSLSVLVALRGRWLGLGLSR